MYSIDCFRGRSQGKGRRRRAATACWLGGSLHHCARGVEARRQGHEMQQQTASSSASPPVEVTVNTSMGSFTIELYPSFAPRTCQNFVELAKRGYYDGTLFHRIIPDFMIQGGDPTGTGRGGESIFGGKFADEIRRELKHTGAGILSMANSGPNTNASRKPAGLDRITHDSLYTLCALHSDSCLCHPFAQNSSSRWRRARTSMASTPSSAGSAAGSAPYSDSAARVQTARTVRWSRSRS